MSTTRTSLAKRNPHPDTDRTAIDPAPDAKTAAPLSSSIAAAPSPAAPNALTRFVAPPPAPNPSFVPPDSFVPDNAMDFRGVLPRTAELVALPQAVQDLKTFTEYTAVMGTKSPPWAQVIAAFDVANQWSSARTRADAWDAFARTQEGICWTLLRALLAQLGPIYAAVVASDPTMASTLPGLTTLLAAKSAIAHKAVSTKRANAKATAEGELPTHGGVGKRATRAAEKAALAEKSATPTPGHGAPTGAHEVT